jgi:Flp pilus assembly protein CpaB
MEATHRKRAPFDALKGFAGTRRGATIIAAVAAALAGLVLLAFTAQYRDSVRGGTVQRTVLVADRLIPKGTSGDVIVAGGLFKPTSVQQDSVDAGALVSASALAGKVATRDVYPGEQLAASAFLAGADPLRGQLRPDDRGISLALDAPHAMGGEIRAGDHVDVLAGFNATNARTGQGRPELRTLLQDVLVLGAPATTAGSSNGTVTVRVGQADAPKLAFAADNGKLWLVLRPPVGAKNRPPSSVTLDSLLTGTPSIPVGGNGR